MRYLRPTSLTWWSGLFACVTGILALTLPADGRLDEVARLIALLAGSGDASPAGLICLGLGLIGLRERLGFGAGS